MLGAEYFRKCILAVIRRDRAGTAPPVAVPQPLDAAYAEMALDGVREREASEWVDSLVGDHLQDAK